MNVEIILLLIPIYPLIWNQSIYTRLFFDFIAHNRDYFCIFLSIFIRIYELLRTVTISYFLSNILRISNKKKENLIINEIFKSPLVLVWSDMCVIYDSNKDVAIRRRGARRCAHIIPIFRQRFDLDPFHLFSFVIGNGWVWMYYNHH